jgi:hypothetical protein
MFKSFKFSITDPTTKRLVMEHFVDQFETRLDELLQQGVDPDLLDSMRNRPVRDFLRASQVSSLHLEVFMDGANLRHVFDCIEDVRKDKSLREYFVRHGASPDLLNKMFKMSRAEVIALREMLLGDGAAVHVGRPAMPTPMIREAIHKEWDVLLKKEGDKPTRERLYLLHQEFAEYSIAALWAVVNEFGIVEQE